MLWNLLEFTRQTLKQLMDNRKILLVTLLQGRFTLLKALASKIKDYRVKDSKTNYQALLFGDNKTAEIPYDYSFRFDPKSYPTNSFYEGLYQFNKHYYRNIICTFDSEEELDCAKDIDQCNEVKTWVRNLVHDSWAFRLPLSIGHFFCPDFVTMMNDGRIFIIKYKGEHLVEGSPEKELIGQL